MKLVFDTDALRLIADQDTPSLAARLKGESAMVWIPASTFYELERHSLHRLQGVFEGSRASSTYLQWLEAAWAGDQTGRIRGGVLPFDEPQAVALAKWLFDQGWDWYVRQKVMKVLTDARPLIMRAMAAVRERERWEKAGPNGLKALQYDFWSESEALISTLTTRDLWKLKVSGTIDWLNVGAAIQMEAMLVTNDKGIEYQRAPFGIVSPHRLFEELGLGWKSATVAPAGEAT